jgi:ABC-type multidrug transport system fused ATPase/permease subunit
MSMRMLTRWVDKEQWEKSRERRGRSLQVRGFKHLYPYVWARRWVLAGAIGAVLGATAVELLKPWPLAFVFDYLLKDLNFLPAWAIPPIGDPRTWLLGFVCALIILISFMSSVSAYFKDFLLYRLGEEIVFELRVALFGHIQRLSLTYHDTSRIGDVLMRISRDAESVRDLVSTSILQWSTASLMLVTTLGVMAYMDWRLSLVGVLTVGLLLPVEFRLRKQIKQATKRKRDREVEVTSVMQETITAMGLVKAFGRERHQETQFGRESSESVRAGIEAARLEAQYVRSVEIVSAVSTCAVIWWGVNRVFADALTPGELLVFVQYVRGLHGPLRDVAKQSIRWTRGSVGLERMLETFETQPDVVDSPTARPAPRLRGDLEFEGVSFGYRPGVPVLTDVSFRIEAGQTVALVGYSGAGKSTIMSLIPRLYDPSAGRVLIDGQDIREFKLESLREQTAFVLQESVLFQASLLENILYGRPHASAEEVDRAVRAASVEPFVRKLKDGLQTVVGPRGATLSGGERQRVAIARAMIRSAPILLLDEPTTGLDVENEHVVLDALDRLMTGKTTLLISHKIGLIERADVILVIDGGRLVESGSPAELRERGGLYARLCEMAAANFGVIDDRPDQPAVAELGG